MNQTQTFQKLLICCFMMLAGTPVYAQITPDGTLGAEGSRLTPDVLINGANANRIDGGAQRGSNLFHSFSQFNINDGQRVYFGNPSGVQNILTRVTGGQVSNILGTLGVDGNANLFLINPNGILFGKNASLDIRGSFVGTTANGVQFGNQGIFSATNPEAPPLLTVQPSALFLNQINQTASIQNNSIAPAGKNPAGVDVFGLRVPDGKSLLLVGGNVRMDGGWAIASGGRIELGGLTEAGSIGITNNGNNFSLSFPDGVQRGDISLTNQAVVGVIGGGGGSIAVNARNLDILAGSQFVGGIGQGLGTTGTQAGNITVDATGQIKLAGTNSGIFAGTNIGAVGRGGDITIKAGEIAVENSVMITSETYGKGDAGDITINTRNLIVRDSQLSSIVYGEGNAGTFKIIASDSVELSGEIPPGDRFPGGILATLNVTGKGKGGSIYLETRRLSVSDGSKVQTATLGEGDAGNLFIRADEIDVFDTEKPNLYSTGIFATVGLDPRTVKPPKGNGGNLTIETRNLSIRNGGQVDVSTQGEGNGGQLFIKASDSIEVTGDSPYTSVISAAVTDKGVGNGGSITIETPKLSVKDGGEIISSTSGRGDAGKISITARDAISLDAAYIANSVQSIDAVGNAGKMDITTGSLSVSNGGQINSFTRGRGNAGDITIQAKDAVSFDGRDGDGLSSGSFSSVETGAVGNGSNINITAGSLSLTNGGQIGVGVYEKTNTLPGGQGIGGNVNINVRDTFRISGADSGIFGSLGTGATGRSGDIKVQAGNIFVKDGGEIISSTFGNGDSGNISITARNVVSLDRSAVANLVLSREAIGNAGKIDITTDSLSLTNGAQINSSTRGQGNAGNITIQAKDAVTFDGFQFFDNRSSIAYTGLFSDVNAGAVGNGANINITAGSLSLTNGGQIRVGVNGKTNTLPGGQGIGGNVNVNVRDAFTISGANSGIFGSLGTGATGRSGDIKVQAGNIFVKDGGDIISSTFGNGDSGNISITAHDAIFLDAAYIVNNVQSRQAIGNAGNIDITTGSLEVTNGAQINSFTRGQGNAGNITIQARDAVKFDGVDSDENYSGSSSDVQAGAVGNGGSINITASNLSLTNGGELGVGVFGTSNRLPAGQGNGGIININLRDTLTVSGTNSIIKSGLGIETLGRSGNIKIESGKVQVIDGGIITSRSRGKGTAGEIDIKAKSVRLNNGQISAETASSDGGNINLNLSEYLLLRNNSFISTTAGTAQAGGNGGNITINTPFIVAVPKENSDIIANAYTGRGGNINISTQSLFGIQPRPKPTSESNDITASSELGVQGQVDIRQPEVQTTLGFIELPNQVVDASNQIAQICPRSPNAKPLGEFIITGRGSLQPNPLEPMAGRLESYPLATLDEESSTHTQTRERKDVQSIETSKTVPAIVEAQGWVKTADGEIFLVSYAPEATPSGLPTASACPNRLKKY